MPTGEDKNIKNLKMPPDMLPEVMDSVVPRENKQRYTVLVLEDNADDRMEISRTLKKSPYVKHIQSFPTADKLKTFLVEQGYFKEDQHPSETLVLMDVYLPGTTGIELLSEMKLNPATASIPIIIVTGDTSKEVVQAAHNLKANAYVTKPIKLEDIHEVMDTGTGWPEEEKKK
jgi:CheY-like chemotaxis protein